MNFMSVFITKKRYEELIRKEYLLSALFNLTRTGRGFEISTVLKAFDIEGGDGNDEA